MLPEYVIGGSAARAAFENHGVRPDVSACFERTRSLRGDDHLLQMLPLPPRDKAAGTTTNISAGVCQG